MSVRQVSKKERRREEQRRRQEEQLRAAKRKRSMWIGVIATVVIVVVIVLSAILYNNYKNSTVASSNNSHQLSAPVSDNPQFPAVDNIACQGSEQLTYHVHAHLSIYINGGAVSIPQNLGIAPDGSCFYWLHTHDTTGVIHIEAPQQQTFLLGTFFDLWSGRFSQLQYPGQLDLKDGWTVYVNGKAYTGDMRKIELNPHTLITLAYNSPGVKPDTTYSWGTL